MVEQFTVSEVQAVQEVPSGGVRDTIQYRRLRRSTLRKIGGLSVVSSSSHQKAESRGQENEPLQDAGEVLGGNPIEHLASPSEYFQTELEEPTPAKEKNNGHTVFQNGSSETAASVLPEYERKLSGTIEDIYSHYDIWVRFAQKFSLTLEEAEDVVQDSFVSILTTYPDAINFPRALLSSVIKNKAIDLSRRKGTQVRILTKVGGSYLRELEESPEDVATANVISGELSREVPGLLKELSIKQGQTMTLLLSGLTRSEVREQMNVTDDALRALIHAARVKIKKLLKERDRE